jgi:hypothetical protein
MLANNGKVVSERHAEAAANGLLTAGQMAKKIKRVLGVKVLAKELKPYADEWHHSGFYKGGNGSTMGRTYFFKPDVNLERLYESVCNDRAELEKPQRTVYQFGVKFRKGYGRRKWIPLAHFEVLEIPADQAGISDEVSPEDYELLKKFEGEELEPYESFYHFKERMLV